jgi:hypothetical protein
MARWATTRVRAHTLNEIHNVLRTHGTHSIKSRQKRGHGTFILAQDSLCCTGWTFVGRNVFFIGTSTFQSRGPLDLYHRNPEEGLLYPMAYVSTPKGIEKDNASRELSISRRAPTLVAMNVRSGEGSQQDPASIEPRTIGFTACAYQPSIKNEIHGRTQWARNSVKAFPQPTHLAVQGQELTVTSRGSDRHHDGCALNTHRRLLKLLSTTSYETNPAERSNEPNEHGT